MCILKHVLFNDLRIFLRGRRYVTRYPPPLNGHDKIHGIHMETKAFYPRNPHKGIDSHLKKCTEHR